MLAVASSQAVARGYAVGPGEEVTKIPLYTDYRCYGDVFFTAMVDHLRLFSLSYEHPLCTEYRLPSIENHQRPRFE